MVICKLVLGNGEYFNNFAIEFDQNKSVYKMIYYKSGDSNSEMQSPI